MSSFCEGELSRTSPGLLVEGLRVQSFAGGSTWETPRSGWTACWWSRDPSSNDPGSRTCPSSAKAATGAIDRAGRFALDLPPGRHDLRVVDAATGVTVHETDSPATIPAGQEAEVRLALRLTRVDVKLVPSTAGSPIRLRALAIEALPAQADRFRTMFGAVTPGAGGLRIDPGQHELTCWLPAGEYRLRAESQAGSLTAGNTYRTLELATQTISVPAKGTLQVALEVGPPPEVAETEKE